jgi:uncharacterized protein (DUF2164 family)
MNAEEFIDNKEMRSKVSGRVEVMDKVKKIAMIPNAEFVSQEMVAKYYEVPVETIKTVVNRNLEELEESGYKLSKKSNLKLKFQNETLTELGNNKGVKVVFTNGATLLIPNRGLRTFSKQCVYHIGLLLRDSEVAQEIRKLAATLLTNTNFKEQEKILNNEEDKEKNFAMNIGEAFINGGKEDVLIASQAYAHYLKDQIEDRDNVINIFHDELNTWEPKALANALVRKYAQYTNTFYGKAWNELYYDLRYKSGISINGRKKKKNQSKFQTLTDDEKMEAIKLMIIKMQDHNISYIDILKHKEKVEK